MLQKQVGGLGKAGDRSLCGQPEQLVDDAVLGEDIRLDYLLDLALVQHVHGPIGGKLRYDLISHSGV